MLTSKSMMFNGEYIENLIEGYTTLNVTGREMAEIEIDALEINGRDGALFRRSKYKPRILTIEFCLEGDELNFNPDNTVLIERMNQLNGILETKDEVRIIFRDEPDKYYMGIRNGKPDVEMALGIIKGTFELYCADPFKYSVDIMTAEPEITEESGAQTFLIDYHGTHRSFPRYEVEFYTQNKADNIEDIIETDLSSDELEALVDETGIEDETSTGLEDESLGGKGSCGYVAFFDDEKHVLQFGNPDITNEPTEAELPVPLIKQNFQTLGSFGQTAQEKWLSNSAVLPTDPSSGSSYITERGTFDIAASYNNARSGSVTSTLLSNSAGTSVKYTVTVTANTRTTTGVKFNVSVTATFSAAVPKKGVITATINVHNTDHNVSVKKSGTAWAKGKKVTVTTSFTVSDLSPQTDAIGSIKFKATRSGGTGSVGARANVTCNNAKIPVYMEPVVNSYYLSPYAPSLTPAVSGKFWGPTLTRNIPVDSSGNRGWSDFLADFHLKFCSGSGTNDNKQMGGIFVGVISGEINQSSQLINRKILAGVSVMKNKAGNNGYYNVIGDGNYISKDNQIDLSIYNLFFGANRSAYTTTTGSGASKKTVNHPATTTNKHILINKNGTLVTFTIGGKEYKWNTAPENDKAYQVVMGIFSYSSEPRMAWQGFYNVTFTPGKIDPRTDEIPFKIGDKLVAESGSAEIFLNSTSRPELGALGNDWEYMYLEPGMNQIGVSYSDWCNDEVYRQCTEDYSFDETETYFQKSGNSYVEVSVSEATFNTHQSDYYVKESCAPKFAIKYREVYS